MTQSRRSAPALLALNNALFARGARRATSRPRTISRRSATTRRRRRAPSSDRGAGAERRVPAARGARGGAAHRRAARGRPQARRDGDPVAPLHAPRRLSRCVARGAALPYFVVRGRGFFAAQEVRDLASALSVIDDRDDTLALVALLRSPIVRRLRRDAGAAVARRAAAHARRSIRRRRCRSAAPADERGAAGALRARASPELRRVADRLGPAAVRARSSTTAISVAVLASTPDGEQRVANLMRLVEKAREFEAARRRSARVRQLAAARGCAGRRGGGGAGASRRRARRRGAGDDRAPGQGARVPRRVRAGVRRARAPGSRVDRLRRRARGSGLQAARRARGRGVGRTRRRRGGWRTRASSGRRPSRCACSTSRRRARAIWWSSRASRCARTSRAGATSRRARRRRAAGARCCAWSTAMRCRSRLVEPAEAAARAARGAAAAGPGGRSPHARRRGCRHRGASGAAAGQASPSAVTQLADFQLCPRRYQQFHALGLQEHPASSRAASPDVAVEVDVDDACRRSIRCAAARSLTACSSAPPSAARAPTTRPEPVSIAGSRRRLRDRRSARRRGARARGRASSTRRSPALSTASPCGASCRSSCRCRYDGGVLYLRGQMDLVVLTPDGRHRRRLQARARRRSRRLSLSARRLRAGGAPALPGGAVGAHGPGVPQGGQIRRRRSRRRRRRRRSRRTLAELGRSLSAARAADEWAQRPLATCHRLRCGFIYRCYPAER